MNEAECTIQWECFAFSLHSSTTLASSNNLESMIRSFWAAHSYSVHCAANYCELMTAWTWTRTHWNAPCNEWVELSSLLEHSWSGKFPRAKAIEFHTFSSTYHPHLIHHKVVPEEYWSPFPSLATYRPYYVLCRLIVPREKSKSQIARDAHWTPTPTPTPTSSISPAYLLLGTSDIG